MLKLHGYFRDGAILQRGKPLNVSGYADGKVTCFLRLCSDLKFTVAKKMFALI